MCGILAYCSVHGVALPERSRFEAALSTMAARGPDAGEVLQVNGSGDAAVLLGHRRLSIQDISAAGSQPMTSACGRFTIIYNGEVYNAPHLRRTLEQSGTTFRSTSDTEVILEGFAAWGDAVFSRLHGMFAMAIWDRQLQSLVIARDHVGIKPLYVAFDGAELALASDARALRTLGFGASMDRDALTLYLLLGYVPTGFSIWQGIRKLDPGSFMEWRPGQTPRTQRFWTAPDGLDNEGRSTDLSDLIDSVVEEQLLSDVPVGLFLSGGIDSSVIASSIARVRGARDDIVCMSVGFPESPDNDESPLARRTAEILGLPIEVLPLERGKRPSYQDAVATLDEPLAFSAVVTQTAISRLAAERNIKVVLTGDGGDELFGGYVWYDVNLAEVHAGHCKHRSLLQMLRRSISPRRSEARKDEKWAQQSKAVAHVQSVYPGLRGDQVAFLLDRPQSEITELLNTVLQAYDCPDLPERRWRQRLDLYTFCMDAVLPKVDRAGMASSVEARPPLLDHRIINWALSRPVSADRNAEPKSPLRAILRQRGLGFLLDEPKRGFSLKSSDKPDRRAMVADINRTADRLGFPADWQRCLPKRSPLLSRRLALMHWLALWRDAQGRPN